jgi:large subunit ribosomal protein L40e
MPKFEPAVNRELEKQICMRCNARNPDEADRGRKSGYGHLRRNSQQRRNA